MPSDSLSRAHSLEDDLDRFGHLHVHLASGAEASLQRHDVSRLGTQFTIDSRAGFWRFSITEVEHWHPDDSEIHPA